MMMTTPNASGSGCIAMVARSASLSACASSCPAGRARIHDSGTARYRSVTRRNHVRCMRRWLMLPNHRRATTPRRRARDKATIAPAPSQRRELATSPPSKVGTMTSSVTHPSTTVPPTTATE